MSNLIYLNLPTIILRKIFGKFILLNGYIVEDDQKNRRRQTIRKIQAEENYVCTSRLAIYIPKIPSPI